MFSHSYTLRDNSNQKNNTYELLIECEGASYYSRDDARQQAALAALHAILSCHLAMEEKKDFAAVEGYKYTIKLMGKVNIIIALNFLLQEKQKLFQMRYQSSTHSTNEYWLIRLAEMITSSIDDQSMTLSQQEKIKPIITSYLNTAYELIKAEPLVMNLLDKADENYGANLLKHPFYQTLSLLLDDYSKRKGEYDQLNFLQKIGSKPNKEPYDKICAKFVKFIPSSFCDIVIKSSYTNEKVLNADKIRLARKKDEVQAVSTSSSQISKPF